MTRRFPTRLVGVAVGGFLVGMAAGFAWALTRPHPVSEYRSGLQGSRVGD